MRMLTRLFMLLLALGATGAQAKLRVITTTTDPGAITKAIGGDEVTVTTLCKGFQDPHFLDAKPSFMLELNRANLVESVGLELEIGYLPTLIDGARNDEIRPGRPGFLDLSSSITPMEVIPVADRGQGDVHPEGNPHYWLDPENGRKMARAIAARLSQLEPKSASLFAANLAAFEQQLTAKEAEWQKRMAPFRGQKIVTFHKSWSYFAARYGLDVFAQVEPKPGIPPSPQHTLELLKTMQAQKVKLLLMENFYDRRVPDLIAQKTGAKLVYVPSMTGGDDGVSSYMDLFDRIVSTFESAGKS